MIWVKMNHILQFLQILEQFLVLQIAEKRVKYIECSAVLYKWQAIMRKVMMAVVVMLVVVVMNARVATCLLLQ